MFPKSKSNRSEKTKMYYQKIVLKHPQFFYIVAKCQNFSEVWLIAAYFFNTNLPNIMMDQKVTGVLTLNL